MMKPYDKDVISADGSAARLTRDRRSTRDGVSHKVTFSDCTVQF